MDGYTGRRSSGHRPVDQGTALDEIWVAWVLPDEGDQVVLDPVGGAEWHHRAVAGHAQGANREKLSPSPLADLGELDSVPIVQGVETTKPSPHTIVPMVGAIYAEQLQRVKIDLGVKAGEQGVEVARIEGIDPAKDQCLGTQRRRTSGFQPALPNQIRSDKPTRPFRQKALVNRKQR